MHNSIIENYEKVGYSIIRNVIDKSLVSEIKAHIEWLSKNLAKLAYNNLK